MGIAIELFWFTSDLINANPSHDGPVARQQRPGCCTLTVECKMYSVPVGRSPVEPAVRRVQYVLLLSWCVTTRNLTRLKSSVFYCHRRFGLDGLRTNIEDVWAG